MAHDRNQAGKNRAATEDRAREDERGDQVEVQDASAWEAGADGAVTDEASPGGDVEELELLRSELARGQSELADLRQHLQDAQDRHLRARADLETVRRRSQQELERAREAGQDSAVLTVLSVFDDLNRALAVADEGDPGKIIPGVRAVLSGLERNLGSLGLVRSGEVGERFDPEQHEALTTLPAPSPDRSGTIAEVFEAGFTKGERLVRPARVVVYQ